MELNTAVRHGARLVVVIANNEAWGIEDRDRIENYADAPMPTQLPGVRYDLLAQALGRVRRTRRRTREAAPVLQRALAHNGPAVLDVAVTRDDNSPDFKNGLADLGDHHASAAWNDLEKEYRPSDIGHRESRMEYVMVPLPDGRDLKSARMTGAHALVVVTGTPGGHVPDDALADACEARGVRLIQPLRPGYGNSTRGRPAVIDFAEDVDAVLQFFGVTEAVTWGGSGGGSHSWPWPLHCPSAAPRSCSSRPPARTPKASTSTTGWACQTKRSGDSLTKARPPCVRGS